MIRRLPLLILAVGACYGFTLSFPFVFDDFSNIAGNLSIRDLEDLSKIIRFNPSRPVTYLTFALNFHFGGEHVFGYRLVNILIHCINSILVWMIAAKLFTTPAMRSLAISAEKSAIAFFVAMMFAVHPLMTEAVTYVVQRLVSLSTLFFLASVVQYLHMRLSRPKNWGLILAWTGLVISSLLAFFTRENTWVLPLILLGAERAFFRRSSGSSSWTAGLIAANFVMFLLILIWTIYNRKYFLPIPPIETHDFTITPANYYPTQIRVICTYMRLLILPYGQVFDRDFPMSFSFVEPDVVMCGLFLLGIVALMAATWNRLPLIFFSLWWFMITVLPQSLVPRPNPFFEHRIYLPAVGLILLVVYLGFLFGRKHPGAVKLFFILAGIVLMALTITRNRVWKDEVSLWEDTVSKSPGNPRAWSNLGYARYTGKQYAEAAAAFRKAVGLMPRRAGFWYNLALAEQMQGSGESAIFSISHAILLDSLNARYYNDRGVMLAITGRYTAAAADFSKALQLEPGLRSAEENLARLNSSYFTTGKPSF